MHLKQVFYLQITFFHTMNHLISNTGGQIEIFLMYIKDLQEYVHKQLEVFITFCKVLNLDNGVL